MGDSTVVALTLTRMSPVVLSNVHTSRNSIQTKLVHPTLKLYFYPSKG